MPARATTLLLVLVLTGAACSGGSDTDDDGPLVTAEPTDVTAAEVPPAPAPGTGVLVLGGTHDLEVTACRLSPDEAEPAGARTLLAAEGSGTTSSGVDFTVEVQRFVTGTEVQTFTDTVTYTDSGRIMQAQRVEVAGQVTDLRHPEATSSLIRPRDGGLSASGIAGPPGASPDDGEGSVGIALNLTCA